jgi:hypothetical protein
VIEGTKVTPDRIYVNTERVSGGDGNSGLHQADVGPN